MEENSSNNLELQTMAEDLKKNISEMVERVEMSYFENKSKELNEIVIQLEGDGLSDILLKKIVDDLNNLGDELKKKSNEYADLIHPIKKMSQYITTESLRGIQASLLKDLLIIHRKYVDLVKKVLESKKNYIGDRERNNEK